MAGDRSNLMCAASCFGEPARGCLAEPMRTAVAQTSSVALLAEPIAEACRTERLTEAVVRNVRCSVGVAAMTLSSAGCTGPVARRRKRAARIFQMMKIEQTVG
jgi:hypothetical protein